MAVRCWSSGGQWCPYMERRTAAPPLPPTGGAGRAGVGQLDSRSKNWCVTMMVGYGGREQHTYIGDKTFIGGGQDDMTPWCPTLLGCVATNMEGFSPVLLLCRC